MKELTTLKTMKEIKIMSNPIRMRVLKNYHIYGKPATVKQMAVFMEEVPANIHYHVKKLLEINILELHHTESINGIIAKYYIPTSKYIKIEDESGSLNSNYVNEKEILVSNLFDENKVEFIDSMRNSNEENNGRLISSTLKLTEEEYNEMLKYLEDKVKNNRTESSEDRKSYLFFSGLIETK